MEVWLKCRCGVNSSVCSIHFSHEGCQRCEKNKEGKNFHLGIKLHLYKSNGNFNRSVDLACTCMRNKALEKHQVNYKVTRFFTRNLAQGLALKVALSLAIS